MHFVINIQLFSDASLIAQFGRFPTSEMDLFICFKNGKKEPERERVKFLPSSRCSFDGVEYQMIPEIIIDEGGIQKRATHDYIVWLKALWPERLN